MRGTKEMKEIMDGFENFCKTNPNIYIGGELKRLDQYGAMVEGHGKNEFYTHATANTLFHAYMAGFARGKCAYMNQ